MATFAPPQKKGFPKVNFGWICFGRSWHSYWHNEVKQVVIGKNVPFRIFFCEFWFACKGLEYIIICCNDFQNFPMVYITRI